MRNAFVNKLTELCRSNDNIILLVGDIGFGVFEDFKKEFPKRYFNMGIAEQNSIGVVSGLAKEGFLPIFYTIIPFLIYRPFEQIRNDLCINRRKALLVGVGAGLSYGALGPTHHSLEDIAVMSSLPDVSIYTPSSPAMVGPSLEAAIKNELGPTYIRLGKNGELNLKMDVAITHKWTPIRFKNPGGKILILTHGPIAKLVETVIGELGLDNLITFGIVEQIKPFPKFEFSKEAKNCKIMITVEENYSVGSLLEKTLVALSEINSPAKVHSINVPHRFITEVGSQEEILEIIKMSKSHIISRIREIIGDA